MATNTSQLDKLLALVKQNQQNQYNSAYDPNMQQSPAQPMQQPVQQQTPPLEQIFGNGGIQRLLGIAALSSSQNANPNTDLGQIMGGAGRTYLNNNAVIAQGNFGKEIQQIHNTNFIPDANGRAVPLDPGMKMQLIMGTIAKYGQNPKDYKDLLDTYGKMYQTQNQYAPSPLLSPQTGQPVMNGGQPVYVPHNAKFTPSGAAEANVVLPDNFEPLSKGATPEERDAWLGQLDPVTSENVRGLANYDLDLSKVATYRGNQRSEYAALAKMYNPNFDMKKYGQRQQFMKNMSNTNPGSMGGNILSLNTLIGHLQLLQEKAAELQTGNLTPVNAVINTARQMSGNPNITNFEQARSVVDSELERALTGVGATQGGLHERRNLLNKNASPQQMVGAIMTLQDIMATRLKSVRSQYKAVMGKEEEPGQIVYDQNQAYVDSILSKQGGGNDAGAIYANNPQTKVRIKSTDGGKTWQQA